MSYFIPLEKYRLFIVDYDGTILNSMEMWSHMFSSYLKSRGAVVLEDADEAVKTMTNLEAADYARINYFPEKTTEELITDFNEFIGLTYVSQKLKPGAYEFLQKLHEQGRVVLFSATSEILLKKTTKLLGIDSFFDEIISGSNEGLTKTDGSGFIAVMKHCGYKKEETLICEDAPHAVAGGRLAGIDTLAVYDYSNMHHPEEIKRNATCYVNLEKKIFI